MNPVAPTVYLVDDDAAVLQSLSRFLNSRGFTTAAFDSPAAFLESFDPEIAGCLVLDFSMPGVNGLELQETFVSRGSELPIIFLTGHGDIPTSVQAMKHGAADFLTKPVDDDQVLAAVSNALARNSESRKAQVEVGRIKDLLATLTPREREVLEHVVKGRLNKQIAADLGTGEKTIKVHRGQVMHKMGIRTVPELVRIAASAGLKVGEQKP